MRPARPLFLSLFWLGTAVAQLLAPFAYAAPNFDEQKPVYMQAEKLGYDQKNAIVVARGNVQVTQGASVLYADQITYYQNHNVVRADGNVRVRDPKTGEIYYADRVQLKDDLMQGIIRNFQVRMADNSQFASREAEKVNETTTRLKKAVYSPCKVCEGKSPFWQIKADEVEIDEKAERVYYEDVQLEFYGVPIAYSPYFFHPTPETKRKSGFLKPEYSQSSNLGSSIKTPYYFDLGPDKDATVTPFITSEEGLVMEGEYRQKTDNGYFTFNGSVTNPRKRDDAGLVMSEREIRGHIFAKGNSALNEHWNWGFDIQRSTDDTYMRRYEYGNQPSLNSRIFLDGLYGRSYASIQSMTFQGLDINDDPDREPFVLPLAEGYYESDPGVMNSRFFSSANMQVIAREEGPQSRRLSFSNGVKVPVVTSGGHLFDVETKLRSDLYSIENQSLASGGEYDGEQTRLTPEASVKWRYPVMKSFDQSSVTLEPTVLTLARPNGINPVEIPNEDNQIVEFTEANLFRTDPMPGLDTMDEGSRVAYGMRGQWLFNSGQNVQFLFGQNYSAEDDTPFPYNDETGEHFSDYVGRVAFDYNPFLVSYRYRLDRDNLSPINHAVSSQFDMSPIRLNLDYVALNEDQFLEDREELLAAIALALSDEWQWTASARRDLLEDNMLSAGTGLVFQNDCFTLMTTVGREFTRDRDIEPDTNVSVQVYFKNLNGM